MAAVTAAGCLWGTIGVFSRLLGGCGFSSLQIVVLRSGTAAAMFAACILAADIRLFNFKLRDTWCFLGTGICSNLFFSVCYFTAIDLVGAPTAAILQYTSPAMVSVISIFVFKEALTARRAAALALSFSGCALISLTGSLNLSVSGVACGLGAGLGYALLSIFSSLAVRRGYTSITVNFYTCLFAAAGALLIDGGAMWSVAAPASSLPLIAATGAVSCFLPSWLYVRGLSGIEASRASIMASLEPVVATLAGVFAFGDRLTPSLAAGAVLILASVFVTGRSPKAAHPSRGAQQ